MEVLTTDRYLNTMKICEIMTPAVQCMGPEDNVVEAAALMQELDVGSLPVFEDGEVIGMLTDRDIVIRCVAAAREPGGCPVRDVMTVGIVTVSDEDTVEDALHTLERHQIRRAPVMSHDRGLVGIISLGDIAVDASGTLSGAALKEISQPAVLVC